MIRRIPYPLPQKRQKPKSGIERAPQRIWPRHRRFVKSHCCCVPGCPALLVDPAHLRSVVRDGTGLTPFDWYLVPLCRFHHDEEEPIGPDAFGDRRGIDLWAIAAELVRRSPDGRMRVAMAEWQLEQAEPRLKRHPEIRTPLARDRHKGEPSYGNRVEASRGEDVRPPPLTVQLIPLRGTVR